MGNIGDKKTMEARYSQLHTLMRWHSLREIVLESVQFKSQVLRRFLRDVCCGVRAITVTKSLSIKAATQFAFNFTDDFVFPHAAIQVRIE